MPPGSRSTPDLRLPNRRLFACAAIAASIAAVGAQAAPEPPPARIDVVNDRLQDIERALQESRQQTDSLQEKASALARETAELRAQLIRAARAAQEHEAALTDLEARLTELNEEERTKAQVLVGQRERLSDLLGALERLARLPPEAMIAQPGTPQDTLRSAILLRAAVPELEKQAKALRQEIESLALLRDDIIAKRADQEAQARALAEERARLGALLARKATLEKQTLAQRQKAAAKAKVLADQAGDLRELLARIEADRKAQEAAERKAAAERAAAEAAARAKREAAQASRARTAENGTQAPAAAAPSEARVAALGAPHPGSFGRAKGRLALPAQGRLVQAFGERLSIGGESRGITIETQPGAQIVAPYDGQVVFAGPFRDYGQLLIIEHSEGYHTLLAGFERIDSAVNQTLLAGEPVGVMADPAVGNPRLYIELRHNGRPINPLPWMATPINKVSG